MPAKPASECRPEELLHLNHPFGEGRCAICGIALWPAVPGPPAPPWTHLPEVWHRSVVKCRPEAS